MDLEALRVQARTEPDARSILYDVCEEQEIAYLRPFRFPKPSRIRQFLLMGQILRFNFSDRRRRSWVSNDLGWVYTRSSSGVRDNIWSHPFLPF